MAAMHIFCAWKVLAFSIHSCNVIGMVDMERIMVVICWSIPRKKWSMRVVLSEIAALAARFWKSVMNFWKPSLKVPSSSQKVF